MTRVSSVLLLGLLVTACGGGDTATVAEGPAPAAPAEDHLQMHSAIPPKAGWTTTDGVNTPESVYYDRESGFIFSSQVNGDPGARDGNGSIVKMNGDGSIVKADFVTGLNAPKGLRVHGSTLWVSDIDEVLSIDVASGAIATRVKIEGSQFLNDVAVDSDGTVYVSDMLGNRIYAIRNGTPVTFAEGESLEWPNGLLAEGGKLIVGGWGKPEADFTTKVPGHLFALDLQTKAKTLITPKPLGNIDGIESDGKGGYLITDYLKGQLVRVSASGEPKVLKTFKAGSADIGFVPASGIVLVPHMNENQVAAYDISGDLQ